MPQKLSEGLFSNTNNSQGPGEEEIHTHCDYECQHKANIYTVLEQDLPIMFNKQMSLKVPENLGSRSLAFNAYIFHPVCMVLCFIFHCVQSKFIFPTTAESNWHWHYQPPQNIH